MPKDEIQELSEDKRDWLNRAEQHLLDIIRRHYGDFVFDNSESDLLVAQRLIDDRKVAHTDLLEAQCIGVVLGNVFTSHTPMMWKRVINEFGDMIALHDFTISFTLYPLTMISKRLEAGREVALIALYRDLCDSLKLQMR